MLYGVHLSLTVFALAYHIIADRLIQILPEHIHVPLKVRLMRRRLKSDWSVIVIGIYLIHYSEFVWKRSINSTINVQSERFILEIQVGAKKTLGELKADCEDFEIISNPAKKYTKINNKENYQVFVLPQVLTLGTNLAILFFT